jgi:hypothetical protein
MKFEISLQGDIGRIGHPGIRGEEGPSVSNVITI